MIIVPTSKSCWEVQMRAKEESKKTGRQNNGKELNKKLHLSGKIPFPEDLDLSVIGKVNETEQDEELGDSFVAPLHSTALYSEMEEICRSSETTIPSVDSPPPGKKARKGVEVTENHSEEEEDSIIGRRKKMRRKSKSRINDTTLESVSDRVTSMVKSMKKQKVKISPTVYSASLSEKPVESVSSDELICVAKRASLTTEKEKTPPRTRRSPHGKREKSQSGPLNSGKKKRSTRDLRKPEVVLSAFEEILVEYKQQVSSRVCQRAIDRFYSVFKEQLIKMLTEVQRLKNLKRENARVMTDANKKRKCLFEAQEQHISAEPQLKLLQRKYEELKHRRSALREATWFLSNLQHLHDDYAALVRGAPAQREQYDICSLPALLLEARGIAGAAQHLRNINDHLQQLVDHK
uniref:Centromere protein U n=1 Tax=Monodelphis domestica TaxID=13616 RepID=A0A5F8HFH9_MONDO